MGIKIFGDSRYPVDRKKLRERLSEVLARHGLKRGVRLDVYIVGKRKMAELNKKHMGKEGPTDVLSFPLYEGKKGEKLFATPEGEVCLGDLVICYPVALEYALKRQTFVDRIVGELAEHGCLHLLGVHHR